jgi:hypothetical protein
MTTETVTSAEPRGSRWEDLVDVFFAPADLFKRRVNDSWVAPFAMASIIAIVLYYVFLPFNSLVFQAGMAENAPPGTDPEKLKQAASFMKALMVIILPVGFLVVTAVTAVGIKLVSSVIEPVATWKKAFMISAYALFVAIPQQLAIAGVVAVRQIPKLSEASFGVLRFMDKPDPIARAVLGRIDIFPIWAAIIIAVGLVVAVGMPKGKAIATSAIVWAFVALPSLVGALLTHRS